MSYRFFLMALLLTFPLQVMANFILRSEVDRKNISTEETFRLIITAEGDGFPDGEPNFSNAISKNFEILSNRSSREIVIVNGQRKDKNIFTYELRPRHSGQLLIPALTWGGQKTAVIPIQVSGSQPTPAISPSTTGPDVLMEGEINVDSEKIPVRSQVIYTLRVMTAISIGGNVGELRFSDNTPIYKLANKNYKKTMNNRTYNIYEYQYAFFPQKSGEMIIPAIFLNARRNDGTRRAVRLSSKKIKLRILPIPANLAGEAWLPAEEIKLKEIWSEDIGVPLAVGSALNRKITLTAKGLPAEQLPTLSLNEIPNLKIYPEKPQLNTQKKSGGVQGSRVENYVIIPEQIGEIRLPEVRLPWWDVKNDRLRYATLPERVLQVTAGNNSPLQLNGNGQELSVITDAGEINLEKEDTPILKDQFHGGILPWITALLGISLCLVFSTLWWKERRLRKNREKKEQIIQYQKTKKSNKYLKQAEENCRRGNANEARQALLEWGKQHFNSSPPASLSALAHKLKSSAMIRAVENLNRHLYKDERRKWDGTLLLEALGNLSIKGDNQKSSLLPELYPPIKKVNN